MPVKLRGHIIKTPLPGYPKIVESIDDTTIEERYTMAPGELVLLPSPGDTYQGDIPIALSDTPIVLRERRITPKPGSVLYAVELIYGPPEYDEGGGAAGGGRGARVVYEYTTEDIDVPLKQHVNYRTEWNHVLLRKIGVDISGGDWSEATGLEIPDDLAESFKWARPGDPVPDGWHVVRTETKPGVESFRRGVVVVTVTKRASIRRKFEQESKQDYTRQQPPLTFGHAGEWLRGGSRIYAEGKTWVMVVQYTNSLKIDPDLYD